MYSRFLLPSPPDHDTAQHNCNLQKNDSCYCTYSVQLSRISGTGNSWGARGIVKLCGSLSDIICRSN